MEITPTCRLTKTNRTQDGSERAPVEAGVIIGVGLDVHAERVAACVQVQVDGATPQPAQLVLSDGLLGWLAKLRGRSDGLLRRVSPHGGWQARELGWGGSVGSTLTGLVW